MNILLTPGIYLPHQRAGSEIYLHKVAKYLLSIGHSVKCIAHCPEPYTYEGIEVFKQNREDWRNDNNNLWEWADVVFCQLSGTGYAMNKAKVHNKKVLSFAHNNAGYPQIPIRKNVFVVYNCENTYKELRYNQEYFILPPPVFQKEFNDVDRASAEYITLINHNENKGGKILIEIAKRLPNHKFMAVQGGYYHQVKDKFVKNIKYVPMTTDIRIYLKETKILISPSEYESYGQAQVEAMCCGIPVIATDIGGFRDAMGKHAIYIKDRNSVDEWVKAIENIDYQKQSQASIDRANELTPENDLAEFAKWLNKIHKLALK